MKNAFITVAIAGLAATGGHAQATTEADTVIDTQADRTLAAIGAYSPGNYAMTDGSEIYRTMCAGCHMPNGAGATGAGEYPALRENPMLEYAAYPINVIVNGQAAMPSLGHLLDDEQVLAVTSYIQSNLDNGYEPDGDLQLVAQARPVEEVEELAEHQVAATDADMDTGMEAGGVVRHPIPGSDFPILLAAEIPADAQLVFLSGTVPQVVDDMAEEGSSERFGDTTAQTVSTLESIASKLESLDLTMGDVIKMQAYLVAPEGADGMDFGAFMDGYVQFFGTEDQPNLPTRSVFEVAGLANPSWLVEIEIVAVRP